MGICKQKQDLRDLGRCRTAALGGHVEECLDCGVSRIACSAAIGIPLRVASFGNVTLNPDPKTGDFSGWAQSFTSSYNIIDLSGG